MALESMNDFPRLSFNPFAVNCEETPSCDVFHDPIQFSPTPRIEPTAVDAHYRVLEVVEVNCVAFSQGKLEIKISILKSTFC